MAMHTPMPSRKKPVLRQSLQVAAGLTLLLVVLPLTLWIAGTHWKSRQLPPPAPAPLQDIAITPQAARHEAPGRVRAALDSATPAPLARIAALRSLGDDLSRDECEALLAALLAPRDPAAPEGHHSEWFHEAALALRPQADARTEFARALATVARDHRRDHVVRDYAVQHLRQLWELADPPLADAIRATLAELADEATSLAPSALLALHLLERRPAPDGSRHPAVPAVPDAKIAERVRTMLGGNPADPMVAKMTAVRIIGDRRLAGFRDDLARLADAAATEHPLVRMAAIAAIARFGNPAERELLERIDRSDPRVATAVDHAIARLESTP